jgi:soluble lytic murein transglycosylase
LALGRYLQSIGDCGAARREFAAIAAEDALPDDTAEARYRLGLCYLRDKAPAEAATVLTQLLSTAPTTDTHRIPATFLLGEALAGLGRWAEAESSYAAYLPQVPELSTLTWQQIGAARKAAGDPLRAAEAYSTALRTSPDWESTVVIRRTLADLALTRKDIPAAVAQYDLLRSASASPAWIAEMQWLAGAALAQAGDAAKPSEAAKQRWQAAMDADPTSTYAHQALAALVEAGVPVDEYQRGLVNYFNDKYALASAAFDRLRAVDPAGRKGDAWYYAGLSYLRQGQTERGLAELGNLIAAYPDNPHWAEAWLAQADARAQAGDLAGAITTYRQFAGQRPDAPQAPTALWRAANWQEEAGDTSGAAEALRALARKYPAADEGWRAYQAAGLIYFRRKDWQRAAETWREMAEANLEPFTKPVAHYWLGRAQAAGGDNETAKQSWQKAVQADPLSYYGLRAAAWLEKSASQQAMPTAPTEKRALSTGAEDRADLTTWLSGWAGEGSLALSADVTSDANWRRGQALLDLGRRADGLSAWGGVQARYTKEPWALAALALAFRDAGANRLSILSAEQLAALSPAGDAQGTPAALRRLAYPLPFAELIQQDASKQGLDPLLVAAVIRQESRFEPAVTSTAGAGGLMQLMPATAEWIAGQRGRRDFEQEQAYWPYINVDFGTYYLSWALQQLDGSLPAALSGYNGGPGNGDRWRKLAPDDDDLMVALIDFGETRIYVQQVLNQYLAYRRLYGAMGADKK